MHLSHAEVGFRDFIQSLFAVTCQSSRSAMQAILPILALSLYFTDRGDDNDNGGDGGDGDDDAGRVTQALLLFVVGRYSIQVSRMWRVFYSNEAPHHSTGPGIVFQRAIASFIAVATAAMPGYIAASYNGTAPIGAAASREADVVEQLGWSCLLVKDGWW